MGVSEEVSKAVYEDQMNEVIALLREIRDRLPEPERHDPTLTSSWDSSFMHRTKFGSLDDSLLYGGFPLPPAKPANSAKMVNGLPDPQATPGVFNPDVTNDPAVLKATIGTPGWTATVRPPVSYTDALKRNKMAEYGFTDDPSNYELDHLIPLCCGGHPTDEGNLWPQPRTGLFGAKTKDLTEVAAQHAVLAGAMTLDVARYGFARDWIELHGRIFGTIALREGLSALVPPEDEP
jgi:hypothetical protein